jgi:hypothetical protein
MPGPTFGRRFAWQNKSRFAIRPDGRAAADSVTVLAVLIRPVFWLAAAPNG